MTTWLARAAIVCTVAGTVLGWLAIGRLGAAFDRSTALAEGAALIASDATVSASALSGDLVSLSESVSAGAIQLGRVTGETEQIARQLAGSADGAALDSVEAAVSAIDDLAELAATIASLNASLGALGVPDVGADTTTEHLRTSGEALAAVRTDLRSAAARLRDGADTLSTFRSAVGDTSRELDRLVIRLRITSTTLSEMPERVGGLRRDIASLRAAHDSDTALWRATLLLVGAAFVVGWAAVERLSRPAVSSSAGGR